VLPHEDKRVVCHRRGPTIQWHQSCSWARSHVIKGEQTMMRAQHGILLAVTAIALTAAPAQAQWVITPYLGINLAGDAEFRRGGPGVSVAHFDGLLGFEFDVERYNHFYKDKNVTGLVENNCGVGPASMACTDLNTDAIGYMGNVVTPIRITSAKNWRPYAAAGLGVIHSWLTDPSNTVADTNQNNFAFNFGGGVMYSLSNRVGLRGDVRYFRALVDQDKRDGFYFKDYGFLRVTVGVTFGSPR
jgi:opacity protein-like surface antigen